MPASYFDRAAVAESIRLLSSSLCTFSAGVSRSAEPSRLKPKTLSISLLLLFKPVNGDEVPHKWHALTYFLADCHAILVEATSRREQFRPIDQQFSESPKQ